MMKGKTMPLQTISPSNAELGVRNSLETPDIESKLFRYFYCRFIPSFNVLDLGWKQIIRPTISKDTSLINSMV